ncbi:hypothetical protein D3C80_2232040 [compost metagenome]
MCKAIEPRAHEIRPSWMRETTSAEKVENVVNPPQKPVISSRRHSGLSDGDAEKNAMAKPMM